MTMTAAGDPTGGGILRCEGGVADEAGHLPGSTHHLPVSCPQARLLRGRWPEFPAGLLPFSQEQADILYKPHPTSNLHLT